MSETKFVRFKCVKAEFLEADIGKVRVAIGDLRMKEILGR